MPVAKGKFIAFRSDRLGARLVSLMNAMRLAEDYDTNFQCAWIDSVGVGSVFNDPAELFDQRFVDDHFLSAEDWRAARPEAETLTAQVQQTAGATETILDRGDDLIVGNAFGVITLRNENPDEITQRFRAQISRIAFSAPVSDAMAQLGKALEGFTAYHIRRGDLTDDPKAMNKPWPHKVVPNEFYERHMADVMADDHGGVALFSDDKPSIEHYRGLFPALKTVDDVIDTGALTVAQRDLLELYAMSSCARIIAPDRSAFSSTAADLTGAIKQSVTDSMDDAQRREAHQALFERVRTRPESFAGDGEVGQSLAHIGEWLEKEKRWADAADLFSSRVEDGLNISFIYPRTMNFQHRADMVDGVIRTARTMAARPIVHVKDQAASEILHGYAHLRKGDRGAGLRHLVNGFWHNPTGPGARALFPVLIQSGMLTPQNFLPFGPAQIALHRRRGPLRTLLEDFPALVLMDGVQIPKALGSLEPLTWDWAPLMRSLSLNAQSRRGAVDRMQEQLAKLPEGLGSNAERLGLSAVFTAYKGDPDGAAATIDSALKDFGDDPLLWHRLSHCHWIARRFGKAATAAQKAVERAPDWPVLQAWCAMCRMRVKETEAALPLLDIAVAADTGIPSLPWLRAQARGMTGDPAGAMQDVNAALALAPLEVDYAMFAARILHRNGNSRAAADKLQNLVAAHRAPGKLFIELIEILQAMGESGEAKEATRIAQDRVPNHPRIIELAADAA
ncbi:MAG: hypothetical protein AAGJ28_21275 [Pseudomonadota bacterium]